MLKTRPCPCYHKLNRRGGTLLGVFVACNKDVGVGSMGVEPYPDKFTNDLDTVDAENLTAGAQITASSAAETAANVLDGSTETAWTAENTHILRARLIQHRRAARERQLHLGLRLCPSGRGRELPRRHEVRLLLPPAGQDRTLPLLHLREADGRHRVPHLVRRDGRGQGYDVAAKEYDGEFRVFNYYSAGDMQYTSHEDLLEDLSHDTITDVILISFAFWAEDGSVVYADAPKDSGMTGEEYYNASLDKMRAAVDEYAAASGRKVNICIDFYPKDVSKHGLPANEATLVQSIKQLIADDDRVDGIDIDWEYPTSAYEWKVYGRKMLDASGKDKYISLALSAGSVTLTQEHIDAVDFVQMMAYDRFDIVDGNHSSFRSGAYSSMRYFVNIGFKPSQLVLGIPLYGRPTSWDTVWTNYGYGDTVYSTQGKDPYTYWDNIQCTTPPATGSSDTAKMPNGRFNDMKRTLKTAIIATVLLASLLASLFALTACNDVASNYVSAKEAWDSAANKMSTDSGTLTATVGTGDAALHLNLDLKGRRVYRRKTPPSTSRTCSKRVSASPSPRKRERTASSTSHCGGAGCSASSSTSPPLSRRRICTRPSPCSTLPPTLSTTPKA